MEDSSLEDKIFIEEQKKNHLSKSTKVALFLLIVAFLVLSLLRTLFLAPSDFVKDTFVRVEYGDTLMTISKKLESAHVINSIPAFQFFVVLYGNDKAIQAGDYFFDKPVPVNSVAFQMVRGDYNIDEVRVTIPEGMTVYEMSKVFDEKLPSFDTEKFIELSKDKEGYLFPDTYFISPGATVENIIAQLNRNFENKTSKLEDEFDSSDHTFEDIIIMASIIEKEASGDDDRAVISGILWRRIAIGMPLQVDATLTYITGRDSSELTLTDLGKDSPFNTYRNKGLPPAPISNPGILSILAALEPVESNYLYYLHDENGMIHYAKTFEEHKKNKALYLN